MKTATFLVGALSLLAFGAADAQEEAAEEPGTLLQTFNRDLPDAIGRSRIILVSRLRWENADQSSASPSMDRNGSNAFTVSTRFGLTSAAFHGLQGMIEGEDITVIGPQRYYNAAGTNLQPTRTVVADPRTTELNQAWLSYSNWGSVLKAGRQRLALDNHRFIGDVAWRQNMQTYDAVSLRNEPFEGLALFYGYLWKVNRVFGNVATLAPANRDFDSSSHLINASYSGWAPARPTAYAYLLDLPSSPANSTATYGGSVNGGTAFGENKEWKVNYRGEFAWQTGHGSSELQYGVEYYHLGLGGGFGRFSLGGGYEVLGSDEGKAFRTPLATLHAHNGWADVFLGTPAAGLRDLYGLAEVMLPSEVPLRFVYHRYLAATGADDFGQEFNLLLSKKLGKHWSVLAKYAYYDGKDAIAPAFDAPVDVQRFWLQVEFNL